MYFVFFLNTYTDFKDRVSLVRFLNIHLIGNFLEGGDDATPFATINYWKIEPFE
jgi:hypothetical protein